MEQAHTTVGVLVKKTMQTTKYFIGFEVKKGKSNYKFFSSANLNLLFPHVPGSQFGFLSRLKVY
jgi:hypothetical protein